MRIDWRHPARSKILLWGVMIAVAAVAVYAVYFADAPLTTISEEPGGARQTTLADAAAELPPVTLTDVLERRRAELERDRNAPVLGNPTGDVTVVEFFDYNCPFCKRIADDLRELIADDPGLRLVYREWPIINQGSMFAARAALAARRQGKYEALHWALMAQPRVTQDSTLQAARRVGLDIPRLLMDMNQRDVDRHLALSFDLARSLAINGTPSFVVGDQVVRGFVPIDQLRAHVRDARTARTDRLRQRNSVSLPTE